MISSNDTKRSAQRYFNLKFQERPMNKLNKPGNDAPPPQARNAGFNAPKTGGTGGGGGFPGNKGGYSYPDEDEEEYKPPAKTVGGIKKPAPVSKPAPSKYAQPDYDEEDYPPQRAAPAKPGRPAQMGGGKKPAFGNDNMALGRGGSGMDMDEGYGGNVNTVPCSKCGRNFGEDRIAKHEKTCKVNSKPKKVKLFHKPITEKEKAKMDALKSDKWRQQHEEFQQAMKYNKKVSAVEAKGGNIRDLAPPPPSSTAGLKPCPYCGRKFGEVQAARHITACKNTINKPKAPPMRAEPARPQPTSNANSYGGNSGMKPTTQNKPSMGGMGGMAGPKTTTTTGGSNTNYRKKF
jgi:hypothetical protein